MDYILVVGLIEDKDEMQTGRNQGWLFSNKKCL